MKGYYFVGNEKGSTLLRESGRKKEGIYRGIGQEPAP